MNITQEPKYELNQRLNLIALDALLAVRITKRRFSGDYDRPILTFTYDFCHDSKTSDEPFTWTGVTEESLDNMVREGEIQVKKDIEAFFAMKNKEDAE